MSQQSQQFTFQVNTSTLLVGMIAAVAAIPLTILMTIWLLQPDKVSAGTFEQSANTGAVYQLPAGATIVPAGATVGGSCVDTAPATEKAAAPAAASAHGMPVVYGYPSFTSGSVNQEQTETNTTTNVDNSVYEHYIYKNSFNEDSGNVEIEDSYNSEMEVDIEESFNEDSYNHEMEVDIEDSFNEEFEVEIEDSFKILSDNEMNVNQLPFLVDQAPAELVN